MAESGQEAVSAKDGTFVINDVAPGTYTLFTQRLGFEADAQRVEVYADQVSQVIVELRSIFVAQAPYHKTDIQDAYLSCALGTPAVTAWVNCGAVFGNHRSTLVFNVTEGVRGHTSEVEWRATYAGGEQLMIDLFVDGGSREDRTVSASPLIQIFDDYDDDVDDEIDVEFDYWVPFGGETLPVTFAVDQRYTHYFTSFYWDEMDPEYRAIQG